MNKTFLKGLTFLALIIIMMSSCGKPIADFTYSNKVGTAPVEITFENKSEKAETYEWNFGDGNTSTEKSPTHRYTSSGNYTITLKAIKGKKETIMEKKMGLDAPEACLVELTTDYGTMTIQLYDATPQHRDNFIKLVEEGYLNDLLFHRVINGFMIQGGDPNSKDAPAGTALGMGGPGYLVPAEFVDTLAHIKGSLAAARTGGPSNPEKKSSGSQFYIVHGGLVSENDLNANEARKGITYSKEVREQYLEHGGTPFLDQDYTVFGRVIKGLDVIDKIAAVQKDAHDRPVTDVKMKLQVIK